MQHKPGFQQVASFLQSSSTLFHVLRRVRRSSKGSFLNSWTGVWLLYSRPWVKSIACWECAACEGCGLVWWLYSTEGVWLCVKCPAHQINQLCAAVHDWIHLRPKSIFKTQTVFSNVVDGPREALFCCLFSIWDFLMWCNSYFIECFCIGPYTLSLEQHFRHRSWNP